MKPHAAPGLECAAQLGGHMLSLQVSALSLPRSLRHPAWPPSASYSNVRTCTLNTRPESLRPLSHTLTGMYEVPGTTFGSEAAARTAPGEEPVAGAGGGAHRGSDDVEQGLVPVDADLTVGQPGHDSLQASGTLLQQVHGQDGCRHLHSPQSLTLVGNSWYLGVVVESGFRAANVEGRGGWWRQGKGWLGTVGAREDAGAGQETYLVGEAVQAVLGGACHEDLVDPHKAHGLGVQFNAVPGQLGVSVGAWNTCPGWKVPSSLLDPWLSPAGLTQKAPTGPLRRV